MRLVAAESGRLQNRRLKYGDASKNSTEKDVMINPPIETDTLMSMMGSAMLLFWPSALNDANGTEEAAIVITGDVAWMRSGNIDLKSLWAGRLPGYESNERIVYVILEKAVEFLAELDRKEVAANTAVRHSNQACVDALKKMWPNEAQ